MNRLLSRTTGRRAIGIALAIIACGVIAGCENPTAEHPEPVCDHVDADGMVIEMPGETGPILLASQWQGTVTGTLELNEGAMLQELHVTFLDADSSRVEVAAGCVDHRVAWTVADTSLLAVSAHGAERWIVDLEGKAPGATSIRFRVWHGDHADFTSLPIPVLINDTGHEHLEADGVVVRLGDRVLAAANLDDHSGSLEVAAGDSSHTLSVAFLDADGDEFTPVGSGYSLGVALADGSAVTVDMVGAWGFRMHGVAEQATSLTIALLHEGHADYTSPALPVRVIPLAPAPSALSVHEGQAHVASWNYDGDHPPTSAGVWLVDAGETRTDLEVRLLGPWISEVGHGASHRDQLLLPNSRFRLECTVADPAVAAIGIDAGTPWLARLQGLASGPTTIVIRVFDGDVVVLESGAMPVAVVPAVAGNAQADYFLKKNGVRAVYVVDGVVTTQPSACAAPANPGRLEVTNGAETDLFLLKYLTDTCGQTDVASGRFLAFRVADPAVASITHHPIHWGEKTDFHLKGLTEGTTTVRCYLLREANLAVDLVSPPLPVAVLAP